MNPDPIDNDEIRLFEEQVRRNPDGLAFARLADAYRRAGDPNRALDILEVGLGRHRSYASAHIVRARACIDLGRSGAAEESFLRVLELDAGNLVAMRGLAGLARDRGDLAGARAWFQRISGVDPGSPEEQPDGPPEAAGEARKEAASPRQGIEPLPRTEEEWWTPDAESESRGPAGAWWFEDPADDGSVDDGDVLTRTMAELYERQGLFDESAAIYRELLSYRPDDQELRASLGRVETQLQKASPVPPATPPNPRPRSDRPTAPTGAATEPAAASGRSEVFLAWLQSLGE
ncbi:MAG: tetratricopeptide repeat protein [Gemmatimonadota bacterium]|nr:tetratricopeptide repeat protein [Gemmatimonadota bacterium]